jgi:hydroxyacylglutathione hydrolase
MILETLLVGPLGVNCYVLADEKTREGIVIDPGGNAGNILGALGRHHVQVRAIVNTHAHFDHVLALPEIRAATHAPFLLHADDVPILAAVQKSAASFGMHVNQPAPPDRLLDDGDEIRAGEIALRVLYTPGHSPGSICLVGEGRVFVGDTLFEGSIGRTDLPGGDYALIMRSIRDKLLPLPDETVVYPGHGASTTIGQEKALNEFIRPLITGRWYV